MHNSYTKMKKNPKFFEKLAEQIKRLILKMVLGKENTWGW